MRYPLNTVPINGNQILHGFGNASITVNATGYTAKQKTGVSTAAVCEVFAVGAMKKARPGAGGVALLEVDSVGAGQIAFIGPSSEAEITVTANHGIPNPCIIPTEFTPAHRSRVVRVKKEGRAVDVPAESPFP